MTMTRSFRDEIAGWKCWDRSTSRSLEESGFPDDSILQNREEVILLCRWIESNDIRSYLEIGIWTGRLVSLLHELFRFDLVAACDLLEARKAGLPIHLPDDVRLFVGDSGSAEYEEWREALGPVDLVMIDGDHAWESVRRDFEINRRHPHRFLAFHDIVGGHSGTSGVRRFWRELKELRGSCRELVRPHPELGRWDPTMGIGIWWDNPG